MFVKVDSYIVEVYITIYVLEDRLMCNSSLEIAHMHVHMFYLMFGDARFGAMYVQPHTHCTSMVMHFIVHVLSGHS